MNKAIVLTQVNVDNSDVQKLIDTQIFKIALNQHAENLKPHQRICTDYSVQTDLLNKFNQPVVIIRDYFPDKRIIFQPKITFKGSTIIAAIEYLISCEYDEILLIADNTVHQEWFKNRVNKELDSIVEQNSKVKIYQFTKGNFNVETKSINDFISER